MRGSRLASQWDDFRLARAVSIFDHETTEYARGSESQGSRKHTMPILASICDLNQISSLRKESREEMQCQIIHDSIHERLGWGVEYVLEIEGTAVGYGSEAIGGPWTTAHSLYEFYVTRTSRLHVFDLFAAARCNVANLASRRTLQKAGFIPCGNLVSGNFRDSTLQL
jgi:hypothetical protein